MLVAAIVDTEATSSLIALTNKMMIVELLSFPQKDLLSVCIILGSLFTLGHKELVG